MLTDAELAAMRDVDASAMPYTGYVMRYVGTADGMGGYRETWGTVGTVVCDLWQLNLRQNEIVSGGQIVARAGWRIDVPFDADVTARDRMTIEGRTFEIVRVNNDAAWRTHLRLEAVTHNEELRV